MNVVTADSLWKSVCVEALRLGATDEQFTTIEELSRLDMGEINPMQRALLTVTLVDEDLVVTIEQADPLGIVIGGTMASIRIEPNGVTFLNARRE